MELRAIEEIVHEQYPGHTEFDHMDRGRRGGRQLGNRTLPPVCRTPRGAVE
jgi:hypothetical protein